MGKFKICLIGCGFMTNNGHGPSCMKYARLHDDVELAACCDVNIDAARSVCEKFGFERAYTDYIDMAEREKPDVVLAVTPPAITKEVSIELLKRKIPVMLEKPPGMDKEQVRAIHNAALSSKTPARAAFNRRYTPLVQALMGEMKAAGQKVLDISCMFVRVGRTDDDFSTTAIHGIDTVKHIAQSDYKQVRFTYSDIKYKGADVTNISVSAVMESGATASLTFLPCGGCVVERISVTLVGYTFFLYLPVWGGADAPGKLVCMKDGKEYKTVSGNDLVKEYSLYESNGFYDESAGFFDMLRAHETPESDVISGETSVELALCIRERRDSYAKKE